MIRQATPNDADEMVNIWFEASRAAHDFIPFEYWLGHAQDMKDIYLPRSESFVVELHGRIAGFLSLVSDCIEALFVSPGLQKHGYGTLLIQFAQSRSDALSLCVYKNNTQAVQFYLRHGFVLSSERIDPDTGQIEWVMSWGPPPATAPTRSSRAG